MRRRVLIALITVFVLGGAAIALALPQQQGSVDLLSQADGQWQGPAASGGSSQTGSSVAGLGDVFGTGRSAIAIGAPEADPGGRASAGSVYVVPGQAGQDTVDLTALTGRGYRIDGAAPGDKLGFSLASLRLGNGDPGLAIGAPYAAPYGRSSAGEVYVIDLARLHGNVDLSSSPLDPAVASVVSGPAACAEVGYAVAGAPADGVLIGAPGADPNGCPNPTSSGPQGGNSGAAYLVAGDGLPATLDLASPGNQASTFNGAAAGDRAGSAVAAAGSPGSFLVGAPGASPNSRTGAGAVYLLHGATPGQAVALATPPAASTTFQGAASNDALGSALSSTVGFAAGDPGGAVELVLGAPQASPSGRNQAGSVFLVPAANEPATVDLATIGAAGGATGGRIDGADAGDEAGYAVVGVGDLNGDGTADLAIGAPFTNSRTGQDRNDNGAAYVVYGASGPLNVDLATLGSRGYQAFGARNSDEAGTAVAGVLNPSGDGHAALLIGAPNAENTSGSTPTAGGAVYALFGFGTPAVSYSPASETVVQGQPLSSLTPTVHATGRPSFSISPALPDGLMIDSHTGEISGTPTTAAKSTPYTVQMSDLSGAADAVITLEVTPRGPGGSGSIGDGPPLGGITLPGASRHAQCSTTAAPSSRVLRVRVRDRRLSASGSAAATRCVRVGRVQIAVARLTGKRCRFVTARQTLTAPRSCRHPVWLRAKGSTRWIYRTRRALPPGRYVVRARAISSTGVTQRSGLRAVVVRLRP